MSRILTRNQKVNRSAHNHILSQYADKAVTNTTTETSLIGTVQGTNTLPANYFYHVAEPFHLMIMGNWSKGATASQLTLRLTSQQGVDARVIRHQKIFSSARMGNNVDGHWEINAMMAVQSIGVGGSLMMHGMLQLLENDSAEVLGTHSETSASPLDTTIPVVFDITAQWSVATTTVNIESSNLMMW